MEKKRPAYNIAYSDDEGNPKKNAFLKEAFQWFMHIVLAVVVTLLIVNFIGQFTVVKGSSMLPTLSNNSVLVIEKLTQRFGELEQGDIVVLNVPELLEGNKTFVVKRIIATEGQQVSIINGSIYVDGEELTEAYINGTETLASPGMYDNMTIPDDCVYILGDNRMPGASKDSRAFGPIATDRIAGRVVFRLFPFSEMGVVS